MSPHGSMACFPASDPLLFVLLVARLRFVEPRVGPGGSR